MAYVNPHVSDVADKTPVFATRNMYAEAREKGFLVKKCDGSLASLGTFGFEAGLVDLTNPEAHDWMGEILKGMLDIGN